MGLCLLGCAWAQSPASAWEAACHGNRFMGAAVVTRHGKPVFEAACGLANAEWSIANTRDTRFRIASISKQFTAAAVLLLQQEGKLSVTDPIGKRVSHLPPPWQSATIHQLLTHTSGIPSYTAGPIPHLDRRGATPRQLLDVVKDKPLAFPHGARIAYNNTGYVLLGMLIEAASGISYPEFVHRRLFAPAGMTDSGFDETGRLLPRRASGYRLKQGVLENAEPVDATVPWSSGGFYSTTGDLVKWATAMAAGELLDQESTARMHRVYPETAMEGMHYGYGIVLATRFGRPLRYHGGGISGYHSVLQIYPNEDMVIVVLSNLDSDVPVPSWTLADRLAEAQLPKN